MFQCVFPLLFFPDERTGRRYSAELFLASTSHHRLLGGLQRVDETLVPEDFYLIQRVDETLVPEDFYLIQRVDETVVPEDFYLIQRVDETLVPEDFYLIQLLRDLPLAPPVTQHVYNYYDLCPACVASTGRQVAESGFCQFEFSVALRPQRL